MPGFMRLCAVLRNECRFLIAHRSHEKRRKVSKTVVVRIGVTKPNVFDSLSYSPHGVDCRNDKNSYNSRPLRRRESVASGMTHNGIFAFEVQIGRTLTTRSKNAWHKMIVKFLRRVVAPPMLTLAFVGIIASCSAGIEASPEIVDSTPSAEPAPEAPEEKPSEVPAEDPVEVPTNSAVLERYIAVATSCEYGGCPEAVVLPPANVSVEITTSATGEQTAAVDSAIAQWNSTCSTTNLSRNSASGVSMKIAFAPYDSLSEHLEFYEAGNYGFFNYWWGWGFRLTDFRVAIATELAGDELRHFVLEEMTQALGLMNDVSDSKSIFDAGSGITTNYSSLDAAVIQLHCSDRTYAGMKPSAIRALDGD